jgi:hypothetical protein
MAPRWLNALAVLTAWGLALAPHCTAAEGYSGAPSAPAQNPAKQVEDLQDRIAAQPEMMEAIRGLQSDPAFQDLLNDPEITGALESGDVITLLTNPKIGNLLNHPVVRDLTKKLGE